MNIQHNPIFDTDAIIQHYEAKDGVTIKYICTSALNHGTVAADIFYRETAHPDFGNRYFGLYVNHYFGDDSGARVMITNADCIEDLDFNMVDIDGTLHYSQHRHDFRNVGDVSIDGGRSYTRLVGNVHRPQKSLKVKNGEFIEEREIQITSLEK
jgi:hypothetical protein